METNHLPSYIGISCAVSGYSNYSAYSKRPLEDINNTRIESTRQTKVTSSNRHARGITTPTRSQTNSPTASRIDSQHIHHITIDRNNINSADQERKELTEKLTASASDRRRSPSPFTPTEDDRHHGAYVGARYCPMPPPSKLVHKHIPLLGIDDDLDPDDFVEDDVKKVEEKIATLYGDEFVEGWKESMSHKSKKEHFEEEKKEKAETFKNPKDLVTLKPTPTKTPEPDYDATKGVIDVPTPNVKVFAGVEKQFLNRLLTDENPPMPKSPSPRLTSPTSSPKMVRQQLVGDEKRASISHCKSQNSETLDSLMQKQQSPTPSASAVESPAPPDSQKRVESQSHTSSFVASPEPLSPSPIKMATHQLDEQIIDNMGDSTARDLQNIHIEGKENREQGELELQSPLGIDNDILHHTGQTVRDQEKNQNSQKSSSPSTPQLISPSSDKCRSVSDEVTSLKHRVDSTGADHIEYEIGAQSPAGYQSEIVNNVTSEANEIENLVSFSPEPIIDVVDESCIEIEQKLGEQAQDFVGEPVSDVLTGDNNDLMISQDAEGGQGGKIKVESTISQGSSAIERVGNGNNGDDEQQGILSEDALYNNRDGHYYLNLLVQEESFINEQVKLAEIMLAEHGSEMDEDTLGKIRSAIGKANLLINKKCNQFRGLCEKGINRDVDDQYAVLDDDLAGFWDMLSIQLSDVRKSFVDLLNQKA